MLYEPGAFPIREVRLRKYKDPLREFVTTYSLPFIYQVKETGSKPYGDSTQDIKEGLEVSS